MNSLAAVAKSSENSKMGLLLPPHLKAFTSPKTKLVAKRDQTFTAILLDRPLNRDSSSPMKINARNVLNESLLPKTTTRKLLLISNSLFLALVRRRRMPRLLRLSNSIFILPHPPSTGRARRGKKAIEAEPAMEVDEGEAETPHAASVGEDTLTPPVPKSRGKKNSPFDGWARTKPGSKLAAGKGVKREGDALEKAGEGKRTRGNAHATTSSSTDA
jgi:hypothetical protein